MIRWHRRDEWDRPIACLSSINAILLSSLHGIVKKKTSRLHQDNGVQQDGISGIILCVIIVYVMMEQKWTNFIWFLSTSTTNPTPTITRLEKLLDISKT